jgi:RhtB (resistance to homoserine/threonine) family protein
MMEFITEALIVAGLTLVTAASPGPDFVLVVRNAVLGSRRAGLFTALGISLGVCVHMAYCLAGIAALIASSASLFGIIKVAGAAYLIYVGFKALRSQGYGENEAVGAVAAKQGRVSSLAALRGGFVTNLLNPKATMFFFALFTQVIDPVTPLAVQMFYAAMVVATGGLWWVFVTFVMTGRRIKEVFLRWSKWIDRVTGGLLIALGTRLAFARL